MSQNQELDNLRDVIVSLDEGFAVASEKTRVQKELFTEYIKIFQKFSQKLAILANKINEEVLTATNSSDESVVNIFQHLSNTLLRMADCSRKVAIKAKNEIFEPIKVFAENYMSLNSEVLKKLKGHEASLHEKYSELSKAKEMYLSSSERLEKQRMGQNKVMEKVEKGDFSEIEKFNSNIKKITDTINSKEEQYKNAVKDVNNSFFKLRKELNETTKSITYNEESRISFSQKNVVNSIKILQDFSNCFDPGIEKKIEDSLRANSEEKSDNILHKKLNLKIALMATSKFSEEFVSFEEIARRRRKKSMEEENTYLYEIFNKVKEADKEIIEVLIAPWFATEKNLRQRGEDSQKIKDQDVDHCKEKIMSVQPYSFYFVEQVYQRVLDMTSFYCKLNDEHFLLLLNIFQTITNNLDLESNTNLVMLSVELLYKMAQISMRIMWKKSRNSDTKPIELLCQHYGKRVKKFKNNVTLLKLFQYIQKKKTMRKKNLANAESKGMINSFTKGLMTMVGRKKEVPMLTEEELFNCLQELTNIMANLLVPDEISLPFIREILGNNENSKSFEYLKGILFAKKDQEQRQKIFYRTEIKGKKEDKMRRVLETKKQPEYAIWITAKRGFFGKTELCLRQINSDLKNIHQEILCRLEMRTEEKWIHLLPLNNSNYVQMKQEVAENSVPSQIEEIITLDVNRSLHNHGEYLSPTILHSLLRTYAYFHKDISYCQGMNYIAGYLYIKTRDQEAAYHIFESMMELRFKELFANEFQVLKVKMYQFERLLAIFHPEISDHFKKQSITSECYIVSWIITLFASSYQYTMESYLIDVLWERFIVWGWREFYRFVLSLFNIYKEELVELTYDRALHFLGEMGRSKMFLSGKEKYKEDYPDNEVVVGIEQYPITEELLDSITKEYKLM